MMRVVMAADHGGFVLKAGLIEWLKSTQSCEIIDLGARVFDAADDYPDFAQALGAAISAKQAERGILICGSGVGACIAANKIPGIRACLCHDHYSAHQGVEHDDMNVLCLGGRVLGIELAKELVEAFLNARFDDSGRFQRRVNKVDAIEAEAANEPRGE
jgi:ribose 5-phosphate isomerase B